MIQITQEEYVQIIRRLAILRHLHIIERNKIIDTWRWWLPCYKRRFELIETRMDLLDEVEEWLSNTSKVRMVKKLEELMKKQETSPHEFEKYFIEDFWELLA